MVLLDDYASVTPLKPDIAMKLTTYHRLLDTRIQDIFTGEQLNYVVIRRTFADPLTRPKVVRLDDERGLFMYLIQVRNAIELAYVFGFMKKSDVDFDVPQDLTSLVKDDSRDETLEAKAEDRRKGER